ncbi:MAG TPA: hypothetical protein VKA02_08080 [Candidatus Acidoferrum sp.]|nr:hypothetical protein [Candidatus Acidoferrum sp.]
MAYAAQNPPPMASEPKGSVLFQRVVANQKRTDQELDLFERIERMEIRKTGSDPKPAEVKAWRVFPAGVANYRIPLSAEGKPISAESYRAELQRIEKLLVWAMQQGPGRDEALAKLARKRKERNDLIEATQTAFIFTLVGHEMRGDRNLAKYSMVPNPKYKPTSRNAVLFKKVKGFVWIDEESGELAKVDGEVSDDASLALFLAKVYKGSHFMEERYEIEPGIWLPTFEQYDFDGRKFLLPFSIHERTFYTSYRRVGPPKEALEVVRGELGKGAGEAAGP